MISLLYIVTPFKGSVDDLLLTCSSLRSSPCISFLHHVVVSDPTCFEAADLALECYKQVPISHTHFRSLHSGIYEAINQAISDLPLDAWYVVLGAGDTLFVNSLPSFPRYSLALRVPYSLSSAPELVYSVLKKPLSGMPYCHNALVYQRSVGLYPLGFSISADYSHFLGLIGPDRPLKRISESIPLFTGMHVVFDNISGISSTKKLRMHAENIAILFDKFGLVSIGFYVAYRVLRLFRFSR